MQDDFSYIGYGELEGDFQFVGFDVTKPPYDKLKEEFIETFLKFGLDDLFIDHPKIRVNYLEMKSVIGGKYNFDLSITGGFRTHKVNSKATDHPGADREMRARTLSEIGHRADGHTVQKLMNEIRKLNHALGMAYNEQREREDSWDIVYYSYIIKGY